MTRALFVLIAAAVVLLGLTWAGVGIVAAGRVGARWPTKAVTA